MAEKKSTAKKVTVKKATTAKRTATKRAAAKKSHPAAKKGRTATEVATRLSALELEIAEATEPQLTALANERSSLETQLQNLTDAERRVERELEPQDFTAQLEQKAATGTKEEKAHAKATLQRMRDKEVRS